MRIPQQSWQQLLRRIYAEFRREHLVDRDPERCLQTLLMEILRKLPEVSAMLYSTVQSGSYWEEQAKTKREGDLLFKWSGIIQLVPASSASELVDVFRSAARDSELKIRKQMKEWAQLHPRSVKRVAPASAYRLVTVHARQAQHITIEAFVDLLRKDGWAMAGLRELVSVYVTHAIPLECHIIAPHDGYNGAYPCLGQDVVIGGKYSPNYGDCLETVEPTETLSAHDVFRGVLVRAKEA